MTHSIQEAFVQTLGSARMHRRLEGSAMAEPFSGRKLVWGFVA